MVMITEQPQNEKSIENGCIISDYVQYSVVGRKFTPAKQTSRTLPSGLYNLEWDGRVDLPRAVKMDYNADKLFLLPLPVISSVLRDIQSFWDNEAVYMRYKSLYKRGILLYGIPGCGKSSVIMLLAKTLMDKYGGIVFMPQDINQIRWLMILIPMVKDIEPNKRIIVVLEDIDGHVNDNSESQTILLNFLDGASCQNGVVTIATTNYPEKLQERITNRPSRFDRRYEVGKPNAEVRAFYIKSKLSAGGESIDEPELREIVRLTEGFTIDHIKEYVLSRYVLGYTHEEAFTEVSSISNAVLKNTKDGNVGFRPREK